MAQADSDPKQKAGYLGDLALTQWVAGDTAGAKISGERALKIWQPLYREKPDDLSLTRVLAFTYAYVGEKDMALKLADVRSCFSSVLKMWRLGPPMKRTWQ